MNRMDVVGERFIELSILQQYRPLSRKEAKELREALRYLTDRYWELAKLKELSFLAYSLGDVEWHHEICARIEKLQNS